MFDQNIERVGAVVYVVTTSKAKKLGKRVQLL
jgi:hypothetical protein